ncbi:putative disease resistance protein RGA3 [Gossypium hirsutum]|uniref:Disease resistance protein RGA3 n=1 Tax=Gossypium hirsutum TaxID=3635 RepID=A0A1U8MAS4_GOSHI|nr:putative disease resistance protein RGA3 [Gossypium hirsutum]
MPPGIGKLSYLETLSMFVVDKNGSHGGADLSELRGLNNLKGDLRIINLGFVENAKEKFKAANLKEKQHLRSLDLIWGDGTGDDKKSLEDLQPHPNLKELRIVRWRGDAKFPSWLSLLTNLVNIRISGNFKHLPFFAQLPRLQQLEIVNCTELEYMDDNSPKGSQGEPESFFRSLKHLKVENCPNMKSWWRTTKPIDDDSNEDDTTVMGTSTVAFPSLSSLEIKDCPLTSMPLYPSLDGRLELVNTSLRPLKQTMKMNMNAKTPSSSTSSLPLSKLKFFLVDNIEGLDTHTLDECLQLLTGLEGLEIRDCKNVDLEGMQWEHLINLPTLSLATFPNLTSLPEWIQHLINLQRLSLVDFPNLTSLPDEMHCLTNLQRLNIREVPQLDIDADWYKIAHIPSVTHFDGPGFF